MQKYKYTAQDVFEQRLAFQDLTELEYTRLVSHFQTVYPDKPYEDRASSYHPSDKYFRFYPWLNDEDGSDVIGTAQCLPYTEFNTGGKASALITFEQFTFTETKTKNMSQSITRKNLESIYNVACSTWQDKISSWVSDKPFAKTYALTSEQVLSMFEAATPSQLPVLTKAGLVDPREESGAKLKFVDHNGLTPFKLKRNGGADELNIYIGNGLVSSKNEMRCLIPGEKNCGVVPEIIFNEDGHDWMIVFNTKK